jgi:hypothetical protein
MSSPRNLARRSDMEKRIAASAANLPAKCVIPGCGRPTMRAAGNGLAVSHCKYHVQHKARHGSHWRKSYRASDLKPYRQAASVWIKRNREDRYVTHALRGLEGLLQSAGPVPTASSLRGVPPRERARNALARLREKTVPPEKLLAIYLAVVLVIEEDPTSHRVFEFRIVQIAKAMHRLASGYHRRWNIPRRDGRTVPFELHTYPRSSGRVLRHLGGMIEECCEHVAHHHLTTILKLKVERYGPHPAVADPTRAPVPIALPNQPTVSMKPSKQKVREVVTVVGGVRVVRRITSYD